MYTKTLNIPFNMTQLDIAASLWTGTVPTVPRVPILLSSLLHTFFNPSLPGRINENHVTQIDLPLYLISRMSLIFINLMLSYQPIICKQWKVLAVQVCWYLLKFLSYFCLFNDPTIEIKSEESVIHKVRFTWIFAFRCV